MVSQNRYNVVCPFKQPQGIRKLMFISTRGKESISTPTNPTASFRLLIAWKQSILLLQESINNTDEIRKTLPTAKKTKQVIH